jgi:hypothetical protein
LFEVDDAAAAAAEELLLLGGRFGILLARLDTRFNHDARGLFGSCCKIDP